MQPSLGEYAALAISGVISLEDTLGVVANRAKLMTTNCLARSSGMLACKFSATQAEEILLQSSQFPDLTVACLNSVRDCVVAGPLAQLEAFESHCLSAGHKATKLSVPYGFHSAAMNPIVRPLERLGQSVKFSEPSIPITSNVFGRLMTLEDLDASYFAKHARQPVRFAESIQHLQAQGPLDATLFLEIGPHPITLPMIRATISTNSCTYLPSLHKDREAWSSISASLRQLFLLKDGIEWRQVFDGTKAKLVDLPGHPLSTAETCVAYQESDSSSIRKELPTSDTRTRYTLLPKVLKSKSTQDSYCFETHLFTLARYICGHAVGGIPMCPASVFHELVLEAAQSVLQLSKDAVYVVRDMIFANPMVYNLANEHQPIHVFLAKASSTTDMEFRIVSQSHGLSPETLHCSGTVSTEKVSQMKNDWARKTALVKRQQAHLFTGNGNDLNNFQTKMLYETVFSRVVEYSADYQTLMSLSVSKSSGEGYGSFRIPGCSQMENCIALPTFTDTLLHAAGFVANTNIRTLDACICAKVESIQLFYGDIDYYETFTVYCSLFDSDEGTILADACALDSTGRVIATAEGMHFKKVRLSAFKALLERTTERSAVDKHSSPSQTSPASSGSRALVASPNGTPTPTEEHPHQQSIKTKVSQIIIETCGIPENQMHAIKDLSALGVDSLMTLELVSALKQAFPNQMVDQSSLMHCRNVQDLENIILSTSGTSKDQSKIDSIDILKENRVPSDDVRTNQTQTSGDFDRLANHSVRQTFEEPGAEKPSQIRTALNKESLPVVLRKCELESMPLYLFHDGSGLCNIYSHLHDLGRNMYGFFNPGFIDERDQALTLVEMAARYASLISISATSPIILGGTSPIHSSLSIDFFQPETNF